MPLTETTREVLGPRAPELIDRSGQWSTWTEALERLWYCRRKIAAWVVVGLILSLPLCYFVPRYTSVAQLMPPESNGGSGLAALALPALAKSPGLAGLAGMAGELFGIRSSGALFTKVLQSQRVMDNVINRLGLRDRWKMKYQEAAREKLLARTTIEEDKKSGVIKITYTDRNAQLAQKIVATYIEELDRTIKEVSTSAARRERQFLEQRLASEKKILDQSQQSFSQFASNNMALDIPEQTKVTVEAASRLEGQLIADRTQLEGLQQTYTADNFRVKNLQAQIAQLEREMSRLNTGKAAKGAADPANPYPSVKNLPVLGVQWADLYRTTKIHETVFELLTQQYEMASIQEAREIPVVKLLDEPSVPERKRPEVWIILAIAAISAAVLASVGILLRDLWSAWDAEDPRRLFLAKVYSGTRGRMTFWRSHGNKPGNQGYGT